MNTVVDFVVVGGGIAGLRAAVSLAPAGRVLVLTKADASESNTGYAQGGIAAAVNLSDSPALHGADTIRAGDGLCDEAAVATLVEEGPRYLHELETWGARFDRDESGAPALGLEAAHSVRRILHAGDATGREIGRALWERVVTLPSVQIVNHALVTDLIAHEGRVYGVRFFDAAGGRFEARASATLLATGGAGQVFRETTNPLVATGDGVALAWQVGAFVADLEFVQFHPTALSVRGVPRFLISEAVRGEGARLVNAMGRPFMPARHVNGDLAPRDIVARGIASEMESTGGPVFLTLAHLDSKEVLARFPTIAKMCRQVGLDLTTDPIPVGPAAHYLMGGVVTDDWGRTSLAGLFAAGETACTGVHGANRLASNSLLEGLVFGARAAEAMRNADGASLRLSNRWKLAGAPVLKEPVSRGVLSVGALRDLMWRSVGLFRTGTGLEAAVQALDLAWASARLLVSRSDSATADDWRYFNLVTVGRLIARAALRREESRGAHYREDFPVRDDQIWAFHAVDVRSSHQGP